MWLDSSRSKNNSFEFYAILNENIKLIKNWEKIKKLNYIWASRILGA